jgi:hypothetical protein
VILQAIDSVSSRGHARIMRAVIIDDPTHPASGHCHQILNAAAPRLKSGTSRANDLL